MPTTQDIKTVLALDLGTTTGWAYYDNWGEISSGSTRFLSDRQAKFEGGGVRFLRFEKWLEEFSIKKQIHMVLFEEVNFSRYVYATQVYGGFLAILTKWCEVKNIDYLGVSVSTIKKFITGRGNASKLDIIDAVKRRGHSPRDDNEADALALCYLYKDIAKKLTVNF